MCVAAQKSRGTLWRDGLFALAFIQPAGVLIAPQIGEAARGSCTWPPWEPERGLAWQLDGDIMKIIGILMTGMLLVGQALAQDHPATAPALGQEATRYGWADVLRVDPVYDEAAQAAPQEECYEEQVLEPVADDSSKRTGVTVLGAIIGGIIGNRFGKGDGRKATTAAGAVAGGVVGNNLAGNADNAPKYTTQRHCRQGEGASRRVAGYDVEYRYRGDIYSSRLNFDPGDRMRVRVSVTPAE
jgi:uncharacterized protein YcfJ